MFYLKCFPLTKCRIFIPISHLILFYPLLFCNLFSLLWLLCSSLSLLYPITASFNQIIIINSIMYKRFLIQISLVTCIWGFCLPDYVLPKVETSFVHFHIKQQSSELTYPEQFFGYTLDNDYESVPAVAIGIHTIEANTVKLQKFMVKVEHASETFITFVFVYKNNIWSHLGIFFIASVREDLQVGSVSSNFQSLRGDRGLTKVTFSNKLSNYTSSVGRVFLNGFSTNSMKTLQLGISQSTIQKTIMMISVITGPGFDLKELWFSFIIFSPNLVPFASYGRTYQEVRFKGSKHVDSSGNIYKTEHKFLGFTLLSFLNVEDKFNLRADFDQEFILEIQAASFVDKFSLSYIIFGQNTKDICSKCEGKIPFLNECRKQCSAGSYEYLYSDGGKACRQCSDKVNEQINTNSTGCECTVDSYLQSGKCKKRKIVSQKIELKKEEQVQSKVEQKQPEPVKKQAIKIKQQIEQESQLEKAYKQKQQERCSNLKNTYWTGYRCACKTGYIPLAGGCQSFTNYVRSLSYSSSLYPTQFSYLPSKSIEENPCKLEELKVNGECVCKDNYFRSSEGVCKECQPNSTFNNRTKKCDCNKGYKLNLYGKCKVSCPPQMSLNKYGQCVCPQGHALMNNFCIPCHSHFGGYIVNNRCYYCQGELRYNGERCSCQRNEIQRGYKCEKCDTYETPHNNVCECFEPYERNYQTKKCQPKCESYQIKLYGRCIDCPPNSYNIGNNICTCEEGYIYSNSFCIKKQVITCAPGQYLLNNQCLTCPKGCVSCTSANYCYACDPNGYRVIGGRCYEVCGDGKIIGDQTCDDGNTYGFDGCSSTCEQQAGYQCHGSPSFCRSICGNGIITRYEQCDDGNRRNGDGCSTTCQIEYGANCMGQPSRCWK